METTGENCLAAAQSDHKDIHPSIVTLANKCSTLQICGVEALTLALVSALHQVSFLAF